MTRTGNHLNLSAGPRVFASGFRPVAQPNLGESRVGRARAYAISQHDVPRWCDLSARRSTSSKYAMSRSASAILRPAVTQGLVAKAPQSPVSRAGASLRQAGSPALPAETHAKALSTLQESLPRSPRYDDGFLRDLPPRQNVHPGPSSPRAHGDNSFGTDPDKPPDERKVKLGKSE